MLENCEAASVYDDHARQICTHRRSFVECAMNTALPQFLSKRLRSQPSGQCLSRVDTGARPDLPHARPGLLGSVCSDIHVALEDRYAASMVTRRSRAWRLGAAAPAPASEAPTPVRSFHAQQASWARRGPVNLARPASRRRPLRHHRPKDAADRASRTCVADGVPAQGWRKIHQRWRSSSRGVPR